MKGEPLVKLTDRLTGIAQGGLTVFTDCRDEIGTIAPENGREKAGRRRAVKRMR
ncbi:hypothetical protein [Serratia marcescens]|uniref:hypothetical protein n=1 Tax=Serratia marcescens TaxID=615 RepID=UPI0015C547C1|nr:hypothetical protein [Serratia marcescens]